MHNHMFICDTDRTVTTLAVGNLILISAACPTAHPFLATGCFVVQVEVSSLGNVGTQIVSVIRFGSLCWGTLSPQFNAHREEKISFYGMCTTFCHKWVLIPFIQIQLMCSHPPTPTLQIHQRGIPQHRTHPKQNRVYVSILRLTLL